MVTTKHGVDSNHDLTPLEFEGGKRANSHYTDGLSETGQMRTDANVECNLGFCSNLSRKQISALYLDLRFFSYWHVRSIDVTMLV